MENEDDELLKVEETWKEKKCICEQKDFFFLIESWEKYAVIKNYLIILSNFLLEAEDYRSHGSVSTTPLLF